MRRNPFYLSASLVLLTFVMLWSVGLMAFVSMIPREPASDHETTDAIVVLTGGGLRLERGFELLAEGRARKMFISGVEDGITLASLLRNKDYHAFADRIPPGSVTLGYRAHSTLGNAKETAAWAAREQVKTIRLVTGNYHMPRGVYELHMAVPGILILPEPVFPKPFDQDPWWQFGASLRLVLSEYHKYMGAWLRHHIWANV